MLIKVNDRNRVTPHINAYLGRTSDSVEQYEGSEILVSLEHERRAAAFVGNYVVLGTRDQLIRIIDTNARHQGEDGDQRLKDLLSTRPSDASIISYRSRSDDAGRLLLAMSRLTRATDGSPDLLNQDSTRKALDLLPRSISYTMFRDYGVYVETHSAVGNLGAIGGLIQTGEE
jgi:hypothetical protein